MPAPAAAALARLSSLSLVGCRVGRVTDPLLGALLALPRLERLALEAPRLSPLLGPSLTLVRGLEALHLASSQLPGDLCDHLASLTRLTRLVRAGSCGGGCGCCSAASMRPI